MKIESAAERAKRRSVVIYIGMARKPTEQDVDDVRAAVLETGAPLQQVSAEKGGKYGWYIRLWFEDGWSDIIKQVDIATFLQMQLGGMDEEADEMVP